MTGTVLRETSKQRVARVRRDARERLNQRALNSDQAEDALDELVKRSIEEHGA